MKILITLLSCLVFVSTSFPQKNLEKTLSGYHRPDEMISLSANLTFSQAVDLLSKVSERISGKTVVSTVQLNEPLGLEVVNIPYYKALTMIVQYKGLIYEEKEDVIVIKRKNEPVIKTKSDTYAPSDTREVKISAVFFEMDANVSKQLGIDWKYLLSGKSLELGGLNGIDKTIIPGYTGAGKTTLNTNTSTTNSNQISQTTDFNLSGKASINAGGFSGDITAVFQFFENENKGEIIASPNITVRDGNEGKIQVGSDFSIKQKDFSGNVVETFFSTGSIIKVTPYVHIEDSLKYVLLNINVERSSFVPDETTTEIRKTSASTQVVMLDGEETVIGGLYINEETKVRTGVPFLKDLPWYVFGLRYIFGADQTVVNKKELVILIKSDLVPTLKERMMANRPVTPVKDEVMQFRKDLKRYQFNPPVDDSTKTEVESLNKK